MDITAELQSEINNFRERVRGLDASKYIWLIAGSLVNRGQSLFKTEGLSSPMKQYFYLAGVLYSTAPTENRDFSEEEWEALKGSLQRIFNYYALMYFPDESEFVEGLTDTWKKTRQLMMPVYLNYFMTMDLLYNEQVVERLTTWFSPFSSTLKRTCGLDVDDLTRVYNLLFEMLPKKLSRAAKLEERVSQATNDLRQAARAHFWTPEEYFRNLSYGPVAVLQEAYENAVPQLFTVTVSELEAALPPDTVQAFLQLFALKREERPFNYPTEANPAERSPLFWVGADRLVVPVLKQLLVAAIERFSEILKATDSAGSFLKHRDNSAEVKARDLFQSFFSDSVVYTSVFETPDSQNEHDVVVIWGRTLLIVEVKATPMKEPFRDPEKGYTRIARDFKSDKGIQKAYDQGLKLKRYILANDTAPLSNKDGQPLVTLKRDDYDEVFIICLTVDDFGIVGANLSLLLEKPEAEPYPWSISIPYLETLFSGFADAGLGAAAFVQYLRERSRLHDRFFASDELEIAGHYANFGGFQYLEKNGVKGFFFTPDSSDFFDYLYFKKRGAEFREFKADAIPTIIRTRRKGGRIKSDITSPDTIKYPRNKKCPCGSGRKYKDCHGASR